MSYSGFFSNASLAALILDCGFLSLHALCITENIINKHIFVCKIYAIHWLTKRIVYTVI